MSEGSVAVNGSSYYGQLNSKALAMLRSTIATTESPWREHWKELIGVFAVIAEALLGQWVRITVADASVTKGKQNGNSSRPYVMNEYTPKWHQANLTKLSETSTNAASISLRYYEVTKI
jgi:hypothetical protein